MNCAWCVGPLTPGSGETWEARAVRHRSGPVGPYARRITTKIPATTWPACGVCSPLVRVRDFRALATRNVVQATVRQFSTAAALPHSELVALFRSVDAALVR